jgi:hemerythrin superfamily protein
MPDGFDFLEAEHRRIDSLFEDFVHDNDDAIAHQICEAITTHAFIEEVALYPALRRYVDDGDDAADEALQEHAVVKTLIARVYEAPPPSLLEVLMEMRRDVEAHVRYEEGTVFPAMRDAGIDAEALGAALDKARTDAPTAREQ